MKQIIKNLAKTILRHYYILCASLVKSKGENFGIKSTADARNFLINKGYNFKPLWEEVEPLTATSLPLSLIIPVYNAEAFLTRCLDSVLGQETDFEYEIICVNDGSTDKSLEILKNYQEKWQESGRLRIYSQENKGISAARNKGIAEARGEYVGFIDNDDYVSPDYVENLLKTAKKFDADIVQASFDIRNSNGEILKICKKDLCLIKENDWRTKLLDVQGFVWGAVMRKSLFANIRFPLGFWFEDMVTKMLLTRIARNIALHDKLIYHQVSHEMNASHVLWKTTQIDASDQYWLAFSLAEYSIKELNLPKDEYLLNELLEEWAALLLTRTAGLEGAAKYAIFMLCSDYIRSFPDSYKPLRQNYRLLHSSFKEGNYKKWYYAAKSIRFE